MTRTHTLAVLVENQPGVLARVSGLFARRGFNIDSLAVGETDDPALSRMTIVVRLDDRPLEQVTKQLHKLINVLRVVELPEGASLERELALFKVRVDSTRRNEVMEAARIFRGEVVHFDATTAVIEVSGTPDKIRAFEDLLRSYGILEMTRTGRIAVAQGSSRLRPPAFAPIPIADATTPQSNEQFSQLPVHPETFAARRSP